jgi:carboxymethylenebutenolidase
MTATTDPLGSMVMCFDLDSHPPIPPIAGGALDSTRSTLTAADGNRFEVFRATPSAPTGAGMLILPDVRGLHPYYEELALRFAERGVAALAIDYFGRTAGAEARDDEFEYMPHVGQTTWAGLSADIRAAGADLRSGTPSLTSMFSIGFCFGGRLSFLAPTLGLGLAGAVGFYGSPTTTRNDIPAPTDMIFAMEGAVLGLFGGADESIPPDSIEAFDTALSDAGVDHRLITYPNAPHSFFDRKAADFADESAAAWAETLAFVGRRTETPA